VSKFDSSQSDPANLILTAITANSVDLTINDTTTGAGAGPEPGAIAVQNANPGSTSTFVLKVNNTSAVADTFNLAVSQNTTFTPASLESGWSVTFRADASGVGSCSTTGAVISNTGVVNGGATATVCAVVSLPANASAGERDLYFRSLSPTSGAADILHSGVQVNTIRAISVTNNQSGQVFPGGTVVYPMTVTNNGNVSEGTVASAGTPDGSSNSKVVLGLADSLALQGWTSVLYRDVNGNNQIDAGEPVMTDLAGIGGLTPGQSAALLLKVFAPAGAGLGDSNTSSLTATTSGAISGAAAPAAASATATSSVISGQVTLTKLQALDALCDGTADASFALTTITTGAVPGACILYQVTAKNVGTAADVTGLVISDSTPENTVYNAGTDCPATGGIHVAATSAGSVTSTPSQCSSGTVSVAVGTLTPGQAAVITFGVQINR